MVVWGEFPPQSTRHKDGRRSLTDHICCVNKNRLLLLYNLFLLYYQGIIWKHLRDYTLPRGQDHIISKDILNIFTRLSSRMKKYTFYTIIWSYFHALVHTVFLKGVIGFDHLKKWQPRDILLPFIKSRMIPNETHCPKEVFIAFATLYMSSSWRTIYFHTSQ